MSLDMQSSIHEISGKSVAYATQENKAAAVAGPGPGNALPSIRNRKSCLKIRMTLIDEFPLRRESIVNLLRRHLSKGVVAHGSVDELSVQRPSGADTLHCMIFSVGGKSVRDLSIGEAMRRLGQVGEAAGRPGLIVLSDREDVEEARAAFRSGARGFIPTCLDPRLVIAAIRLVAAGGEFIPATMLLRSHRKREALCDCGPPPEQLKDEALHQWPARQLAVLRLVGEGKPNKHIAMALKMEESTVKVHVRYIMRKLGATNRTQVALHVRRLDSAVKMAGETPASAKGDGAAAVRAM